ncbi:MAG: dimethylsulfoniopropionate lyase [Paracoccaceae bacterium]|nr:dimethylsulfoniopropionate lyase [Paracoccaceae bacterium]
MRGRAAEAIAAIAEELGARATGDAALASFSDLLSQGTGARNAPLPEAPPDHPARAHLRPAFAALSGPAPRLIAAIEAIAGDLRWRQVFDGTGAPPTVAEGMLAAQIAGPVGLIGANGDGCAGLFLIAPGVHYPFHTHEATEIYYCVHGRLLLQYGTQSKPMELTPGLYGHTPSNRVHSLTTEAEPVLLIYAWTGPLDRPNWIWDTDGQGGWTRANWSRRDDGSWVKQAEEPVTAALLAEAEGN